MGYLVERQPSPYHARQREPEKEGTRCEQPGAARGLGSPPL